MEDRKSQMLPFLQEQYQKGRVALDKKNLDYAIMIFCQILEKEPGFVECREALRVAQFRKLEQGGSGGFFKKTFGAMASQSLFLKARASLKSNPGEAMAHLEQILNKDPNNVTAHSLMADAAIYLNCHKIALISLELLFNKLGQRDMEMAKRLANVYSAVGEPEKAEAIYAELVREHPDDLELRQTLKNVSASRTMKEGGYEAAASEGGSYRDSLRDVNEAKRLEQQQRMVQTAEESVDVVGDLESKVQQEPENPRWWRSLGDQYSSIREYDKALNAYLKLRSLMPTSDRQLDKMILSLQLKKIDRQIAALDDADPQKTEKIEAFEKEKANLELARVKELSDANPTDMPLLFDLGKLYFKASKISLAIQAFQKTQKYPGVRIRSLILLSQCFFKRKMYDLAVHSLESAMAEKTEMDDEKMEIIYTLGLTFDAMGKKEESIEEFKKIYEIDISYKDVAARVDAYYAD